MLPSLLVWDIAEMGIASVAFAAGNSYADCRDAVSSRSPGVLCVNSTPGVITAGALDINGVPQYYSSRGPGQCSRLHPFISAPTFGVLPWGMGYIDTGGQGGGTSSASPQVAGALALMKGFAPEATNLDLMVALAVSAERTVPAASSQYGYPVLYDHATGFGKLRVDHALSALPLVQSFPVYREFIAKHLMTPPVPGILPPLVK